MPESIQEYVNSSNQKIHVNNEAGILRGVKILGLSSVNGRRYRDQALSEAMPLYEGSKVNVNHPKGSPQAPRDYQDRIGVIRNVEFRQGEGLFGELHFNPKHRLSEQLVWDAANEPANVGLSHNVLARTSRDGDETVVEAITKVRSVDLVADPATTRGLFEEINSQEVSLEGDLQWDSLTLEQLQLHRPDLAEGLHLELREELKTCREQIDQASLREATALRREKVVHWLTEHRLPLPSTGDDFSQQVVSQQFLESLMEAPNESAVEQLIVERANLVRFAQSLPSTFVGESRRPVARDALFFSGKETDIPQTAEEFASALRG